MFPTILAWIGVGMFAIWIATYIFGTLKIIAQYRSLMIEKKEPAKSITTSACITVVFGLLSIPLYILILAIDFKIEVLAVLLVVIAWFSIDVIITNKKKKAKPEKTPEDIEKEAQDLEKTPKKDKVFVISVMVIFSAIMRALPFFAYLLIP